MDDLLPKRLDRLERPKRPSWLIVGGVSLMIVGAALLVGATRMSSVTDEVRAKRFVLVDQNGQDRAELTMRSDGEPELTFSRDGKPAIVMTLTPDGGAGLVLQDKRGASVFLSVSQDGVSGVRLSTGPAGEGAVMVLARPTGEAGVTVSGKGIGQRIDLGVTRGDGPSLSLFDATGRIRTVLGATSVENPKSGTVEQRPPVSLVFFDKDGMKVIWKAP